MSAFLDTALAASVWVLWVMLAASLAVLTVTVIAWLYELHDGLSEPVEPWVEIPVIRLDDWRRGVR